MNIYLKYLLGAGAAGLLYKFLLNKKAALENLKVSSIDVYINKEKTQAAYYLKLFYNLKLGLFNQEKVSINIKSIEATFYLNGIKFATLNNNINTYIPANTSKEINLGASINSGNVIASILDIISEASANITVTGSLLTDLGLITFKETKLV